MVAWDGENLDYVALLHGLPVFDGLLAVLLAAQPVVAHTAQLLHVHSGLAVQDDGLERGQLCALSGGIGGLIICR